MLVATAEQRGVLQSSIASKSILRAAGASIVDMEAAGVAVLIDACAMQAPDRDVERRGPPLSRAVDADGAPSQAAAAFAKSCGVAVADLESVTTEKGAWLLYRGTERGRATSSLIPGIVDAGIASLAERLGRAPQTLYNKLNALRRSLADCVTQRLAAEA